MSEERWFIVIAPDGAARTLARHAAEAFTKHILIPQCKLFDCSRYRQAFSQMLKNPDPEMVTDLLNQSLIVSCLDFKATACFVTALSPVTLFTLNLLREYGVRTAHWFSEDYRKATYWNDVLDGYDHFFTIQHGAIEAECRNRGIAHHFLPPAAGCANLDYLEMRRPFDVVFVGIPSAYRVAVLETLARAGVKLAVAGSGWDAYRGPLQPHIIHSTWIDDAAAFRLMLQSKIGLNLAFDNPAGRDDVHIGPRVYDLLAAGCLLLSEENPLLRESVSDCAVHTYRSIDDAVAETAALLANYADLGEERTRNRAAVLEKHRYVHRVENIIHAASNNATALQKTRRDN